MTHLAGLALGPCQVIWDDGPRRLYLVSLERFLSPMRRVLRIRFLVLGRATDTSWYDYEDD